MHLDDLKIKHLDANNGSGCKVLNQLSDYLFVHRGYLVSVNVSTDANSMPSANVIIFNYSKVIFEVALQVKKS